MRSVKAHEWIALLFLASALGSLAAPEPYKSVLSWIASIIVAGILICLAWAGIVGLIRRRIQSRRS